MILAAPCFAAQEATRHFAHSHAVPHTPSLPVIGGEDDGPLEKEDFLDDDDIESLDSEDSAEEDEDEDDFFEDDEDEDDFFEDDDEDDFFDDDEDEDFDDEEDDDFDEDDDF